MATFIEKKIRPSDGQEKDDFSWDVDLWGNYAVVGSIFHTHPSRPNSTGYIYLYRRTSTGWVEHEKIAGRGRTERFGQSVAISDNFAVASTHVSTDYPQGAVFVYKRIGGSTWTYHATLQPPKGSGAIAFGHAVDVDGSLIAVSDIEDTTHGFPGGRVYVYRPHPNGVDWILDANLDPGALQAGDAFGSSICLRGYTLLIGAEGEEGKFLNTGAAYVYQYQGSQLGWVKTQKLQASDGSIEDGFGRSVRLSPLLDWLIVGAYLEDARGADAGAAYIFKNQGGSWVEFAKLTGSDSVAGDNFGKWVGIEGNRAIVGAWKHAASGFEAGAAYFYEFNPRTNWVETKILASDGDPRDLFGKNVAMHTLNFIVGAVRDDDMAPNCGAAYIFEPAPSNKLRKPNIFLEPWPYLDIYTGCANTVVNQPIEFTIRMPKRVALSLEVGRQPRKGKLKLNARSKTVRYTPNRNSSGNDMFSLNITDRSGHKNRYVQQILVTR